MASAPPLMEPPSFDVDKLSYEIFSILESKFLFGYDDPKLFLATSGAGSIPETPPKTPTARAPALAPATRSPHAAGRVCILSLDGGGRAADGLLAGAALVRLESSLRKRCGDPGARIADFFDVAAGSGAGGVLAAMLFARGPEGGRPLFSAEEAMGFLLKNLRRRSWSSAGIRKAGALRSLLLPRRSRGGVFGRVLKDLTLRETVRPVLIPCYDMATGGPFLFSRADAVESEGFNFRLREVCAATCAGAEGGGAVEMRSVDGRRRIVAVGGGVAMGNPTAAAITHVLNNKQEFPLAAGVDDLLVVSIGSGEGGGWKGSSSPAAAASSAEEIVRIAAEGVADMVDQAVAMAFGHNRTSNYIRIQATGAPLATRDAPKVACGGSDDDRGKVAGATEEMLSQRNVESVLFRGKKLAEQTNAEKLEWVAHELIKEHDRRKSALLTPVLVKQPNNNNNNNNNNNTPTHTPLTPLTPRQLTPGLLTPRLSSEPTPMSMSTPTPTPPTMIPTAAATAAARGAPSTNTLSTATTMPQLTDTLSFAAPPAPEIATATAAAPAPATTTADKTAAKSKKALMPSPSYSVLVGRMLTTIL